MSTKQTRRAQDQVTEQVPDKRDLAHYALRAPTLLLRELCNRDFFYFFATFWHTVCPHKLQVNWHIRWLCRELQVMAERVARRERSPYDLIVNIPPGTTKSTICSVMFPVWCWTRWHWMKFLTFSYNTDVSCEPADRARKVMWSDLFRRVYPDLSLRRDKEGVTNYEVVRQIGSGKVIYGGQRFSSSVGGSATALHGDFLIVDDPLNPKQAASSAELATAAMFIDQTLPTRKTDKDVAPLVLIMQRLHQDDPSGILLRRPGLSIKHVCLPGEINTPGYADLVKPAELKTMYVDGLLDPVRLSREVLSDLEARLGQYGYAAQIGQNPTPPAGGMFRVDMFSIVEQPPPLEEFDQIVRYWDKAGTAPRRGSDSSWTVGTKMGRLRGGKFIVLDVRRGRWTSDVREDIIRAVAEADGVNVEIWHEQEPGSGGKESAENTTRNLAGFVVRADRPTGDKVSRADPYSVQVNRGNVWLLRGDWNHDFIEEHRFFPFGSYADQVDSAAGAFSKLVAKRVARPVFSSRLRLV